MTARAVVEDFLAQRSLALVGASREGRKFGNAVLRELRGKGYTVFPVHPEADAIDGIPCFRSLAALPEPVGGVVAVVPPVETEKVVREAAEAGIPRVWMQRGAQSEAALALCQAHGISAVCGECILMYAEPVGGFHRFHRFLRALVGRSPA
jgi:predicted CoA-binding protein